MGKELQLKDEAMPSWGKGILMTGIRLDQNDPLEPGRGSINQV